MDPTKTQRIQARPDLALGEITQPIVPPSVILSRVEFQKRRLLDRHNSLMRSVQKLADDLQAAVERIERGDVRDADYNALAQSLVSSVWISLEANALDAAKDQLRAIEGRQP
jgi:hypothetical protein